MGTGAQVHSRVHMAAGMCRRTERWKQPQQSSANSTDKIVPQIPKAGFRFKQSRSKDSSRIHFAGWSCIFNPEKSCTLHPHLPFRLAPQQAVPSYAAAGRGGSVLPTVPGLPACCQPRVAGPCPCHGSAGPKSRAEQGCLPLRAAAEHWEGVAGLSDTI